MDIFLYLSLDILIVIIYLMVNKYTLTLSITLLNLLVAVTAMERVIYYARNFIPYVIRLSKPTTIELTTVLSFLINMTIYFLHVLHYY